MNEPKLPQEDVKLTNDLDEMITFVVKMIIYFIEIFMGEMLNLRS